MKALACYTVIVNILLAITLILAGAGVISPAPFDWFEIIAWIIITIPVIILGIMVIRKPS